MTVAGNNAYINKFGTGFVNGFACARASNTTLTVGSGAARDSSDTSNISLASSKTINFSNTGANGLDTGAIAASTMYYIFVIGDSMGVNSAAALASTSATPSLPSGYDMYRQVGFWPTDGSSHLIVAYSSGTGNNRKFMYDAVVATSVTAGAQTSYTAIDLSNKVPAVDLTPVYIYAAMTPATANNSAKFVASGGTGDGHTLTGVVATKINDGQFVIPVKLVSGAPKIDYKVSNGSDAVAVSVAGFDYYL